MEEQILPVYCAALRVVMCDTFPTCCHGSGPRTRSVPQLLFFALRLVENFWSEYLDALFGSNRHDSLKCSSYSVVFILILPSFHGLLPEFSLIDNTFWEV